MPTPIIFPDIEAEIVQYLRSKLPSSVFVGVSNNGTRKSPMVIVRKNGGTAFADVRQSAQIGIRVWGKTWEESLQLALLVEAWMNEAAHQGIHAIQRSETQLSPTPSGDGEDASVPVHYLIHNLIVRGKNL